MEFPCYKCGKPVEIILNGVNPEVIKDMDKGHLHCIQKANEDIIKKNNERRQCTHNL